MLDYLRIEGLALIDELSLELSSGMNVLTGETGAGKSIIVDALTLLRGARGRTDLVREGQSHAQVQAQFVLSAQDPRLHTVLQDCEVELEDQALVVTRRLGKNGRGRSHLQGRLTTLAGLSGVGEVLMDICSQHEHHSLTHVARHIELLDSYAKLGPGLTAYQQAYAKVRQKETEIQTLSQQAQDRVQRMDFLRFLLEELDAAPLDAEHYESAKERRELLRGAEHWAQLASDCKYSLYEADDSVWGKIATILDRCERGGKSQPPALQELLEPLRAASLNIEEANAAADRLVRQLDTQPGELAQLEEEISDLDHLQRKHGCEIAALVQKRDEMHQELETLTNVEDRMETLQAELKAAKAEAMTLALSLRQSRQSAADRLAKAVETELHALHMPKARFALRFAPPSEPEQLGPSGIDDVEFVFSANVGEAMAPLHKVASGGELSRVLLAVKGVLSTGDCVVTYVFDEVDTGVGGAVAEAIGQRLAKTSKDRQVLCVTHLPQIAAFADQHFFVEKHSTGDRTVTRVRTLSMGERIEELARMIAGAEVTSSAREHARALLKAAGHKVPSSKAKTRARAQTLRKGV